LINVLSAEAIGSHCLIVFAQDITMMIFNLQAAKSVPICVMNVTSWGVWVA